jgi:hypothetical protein
MSNKPEDTNPPSSRSSFPNQKIKMKIPVTNQKRRKKTKLKFQKPHDLHLILRP